MKNKIKKIGISSAVIILATALLVSNVLASDASKNKTSSLNNEQVGDDGFYKAIWGEVQSIEKQQDGSTILTVFENSFGENLTVKLKVNSKTDFGNDNYDIKIGSYVISQYGNEPIKDNIYTADDILVFDKFDETEEMPILPQPDNVVHNGKVTEVWIDPNNKNTGSITIISDVINEEWRFNFDEETIKKLDIAKVKNGDILKITAGPQTTASLPPQSYAIEIESK